MTDHSALIERLELHAKDCNTLELHGLADHITQAAAALRDQQARITELKETLIPFVALHATAYARQHGFPEGVLTASHYQILKDAGGRVDDFRPLPSAPNQAKEAGE